MYLKSKNHKSGCDKILRDDVLVTDKNGYAEPFNNYLTFVPVEIAIEIPSFAIDFRDYIRNLIFTDSLF